MSLRSLAYKDEVPDILEYLNSNMQSFCSIFENLSHTRNNDQSKTFIVTKDQSWEPWDRITTRDVSEITIPSQVDSREERKNVLEEFINFLDKNRDYLAFQKQDTEEKRWKDELIIYLREQLSDGDWREILEAIQKYRQRVFYIQLSWSSEPIIAQAPAWSIHTVSLNDSNKEEGWEGCVLKAPKKYLELLASNGVATRVIEVPQLISILGTEKTVELGRTARLRIQARENIGTVMVETQPTFTHTINVMTEASKENRALLQSLHDSVDDPMKIETLLRAFEWQENLLFRMFREGDDVYIWIQQIQGLVKKLEEEALQTLLDIWIDESYSRTEQNLKKVSFFFSEIPDYHREGSVYSEDRGQAIEVILGWLSANHESSQNTNIKSILEFLFLNKKSRQEVQVWQDVQLYENINGISYQVHWGYVINEISTEVFQWFIKELSLLENNNHVRNVLENIQLIFNNLPRKIVIALISWEWRPEICSLGSYHQNLIAALSVQWIDISSELETVSKPEKKIATFIKTISKWKYRQDSVKYPKDTDEKKWVSTVSNLSKYISKFCSTVKNEFTNFSSRSFFIGMSLWEENYIFIRELLKKIPYKK